MHAVYFVPSNSARKPHLLALFPDRVTALSFRPTHMDGTPYGDDEMRRYVRVEPWISAPSGAVLQAIRSILNLPQWSDPKKKDMTPTERMAIGWMLRTLDTILSVMAPETDGATRRTMRFDGSSGRRPDAEARKYVYAVLASSLVSDLIDPDGWVFGGIEDEEDKRRLRRVAKAVVEELRRKAQA